jgi:hypothetical protein
VTRKKEGWWFETLVSGAGGNGGSWAYDAGIIGGDLAEMGRSMLRPYKGEMLDLAEPKPRNMLRHYKGQMQKHKAKCKSMRPNAKAWGQV